jgi:putative transposase
VGGPADARERHPGQDQAQVPGPTDSRHDHPVAPNRLDREFTVEAPNTVWLAGPSGNAQRYISYIATREGWLYLAVVLDLFSRPDRSECRFRFFIATSFVRVLRRPLESAQYADGAYQKRLVEHGIVCSMSRRGNC